MSKIDVKDLDISSLFNVYSYVYSLANQAFGGNLARKKLIRETLKEVETEINNRIFGEDPFSIKIEGTAPESIDLSRYDTPDDVKTFVVVKSKE